MRPLVTIILNDLRQRIRDRSMLMFGLVVPLSLIGLFGVLFSGFDDGPDLDEVAVAVSSPEGDQMGEGLLEVLRGLEVVAVELTHGDPEQVHEMTEDGEASVGLVIPDGFTDSVVSGQAAEVRMVLGPEDSLEASVVVAVVDGVVEQMAVGSLTGAAAAMGGVPQQDVEAIGQRVAEQAGRMTVAEGRASDEQLSMQAALVAGQAGMFLLFTVGFGVLAIIYEREQGTLTRLESMPLRPGTVVLAKALAGFLLGVFTTTILLVAGSIVFDVSFGSLAAVSLLVLAAVAASTSLIFIVARVARTSEQATVAQAGLAMVLGIAGGAFFPIQASGWVGTALDVNPVAALGRGLGITSGGGGVADLGTQLATLIGFAVVALVVAQLIPERTGRR